MRIYMIGYDQREPQPLNQLSTGELRNVVQAPEHLEVVGATTHSGESEADFLEQIRIILSLREQGAPI